MHEILLEIEKCDYLNMSPMFVHVRTFSGDFLMIPLDLTHFLAYVRDLRYAITYPVSPNYSIHVLKNYGISINSVNVQVLF